MSAIAIHHETLMETRFFNGSQTKQNFKENKLKLLTNNKYCDMYRIKCDIESQTMQNRASY